MVVLHSMSGPGVHREPVSASYRGTTTGPKSVKHFGSEQLAPAITPCVETPFCGNISSWTLTITRRVEKLWSERVPKGEVGEVPLAYP